MFSVAGRVTVHQSTTSPSAREIGATRSTSQQVPRTVLVIDDHETFSARLGRSFRDLGCEVWITTDYTAAKTLLENQSSADLIISEVRVGGEWAFDFLTDMKRQRPGCRAMIVTAYPSVAAAVKATRLGLDAYIAKPADARLIIELILQSCHEDVPLPCNTQWPSLDRTIWEYINHVYVSAGTMSEAARRLGLDRRSLRRMLSKYPPQR
jgi:two-component system response regulator RegA